MREEHRARPGAIRRALRGAPRSPRTEHRLQPRDRPERSHPLHRSELRPGKKDRWADRSGEGRNVGVSGFEPPTSWSRTKGTTSSTDHGRSQTVATVETDNDEPIQPLQAVASLPEPFTAGVLHRVKRVGLRSMEGGSDHLLTVRRAADRLGVCTAVVYKLCTRGDL